MQGECFCAQQGLNFNNFMNDIPKKDMGTIELMRGQIINKKIRHTNKTDNDMHYKITSDSPLIFFRQHSNFEIVSNCYTYIRIQIGVPIDYSGPDTKEVNIVLKRSDVDQIEEKYLFIIKILDGMHSEQPPKRDQSLNC